MHMLHLLSLILYLSFSLLVYANVEKTIFTAPTRDPFPLNDPMFDGLGLKRLSPSASLLRTFLNASFPTENTPYGTESWVFLEDLLPGQWYEVRVCWLATQPTSFTLTTFTLFDTISNPILMTALSTFSARSATPASPRDLPLGNENQNRKHDSNSEHHHIADSALFLRIFALADYFTLNTSLMETVPPVAVDLILDPLLLNVFPRSLIPTAAWTAIVAATAWLVSGWIIRFLQAIMDEAISKEAGCYRGVKGAEMGTNEKKRV